MEQLIPNRHINSVKIPFIIPANVTADTNTFEVEIVDTKNNVFFNREVDITINNNKYVGVINTGKITPNEQKVKYYLTINNIEGFTANTQGEFSINYPVRKQNETVTIQDIYNEFFIKKEDLIINNIHMETPPYIDINGGESFLISTPVFEVNTLLSENIYLEFIDGVSEFHLISNDTDNTTIIQKYIVHLEINDYKDKFITVERVVDINLNYYSFGFEFIEDNNGNIFISRLSVMENLLPLNTDIYFRILNKRSSFLVPEKTPVNKKILTTNNLIYNLEYPNNDMFSHIFLCDYNTIQNNLIDRYCNEGLEINCDYLNERLDFNKLLFSFKIRGCKTTDVLPLNSPTELKNNGWILSNYFLYDTKINGFVIKQILNIGGDFCIRERINNSWSAWISVINHKHKATDIIQDKDHRFVTDKDIEKWNEISSSTWLKPVSTVVELPNTGVKIGSIVYVSSENKLHKFNGTKWESLYPIANATTDGLLSKEDYKKIVDGKSDSLLKEINKNTLVYGVEASPKYDDKSNIIDGILTNSVDTQISNQTVLFGFKTKSELQTIDNKSDNTVILGTDNRVFESLNSISIGNNNSNLGAEKSIAIGNDLTVNQTTKIALGQNNKGVNYFEIGALNREGINVNLFELSQEGNGRIIGGLSSENLSSYIDENDGSVIERNTKYSAFTIDGNAVDTNELFNNFVEFDKTNSKLIFYKPYRELNPDYDEDNNPNVPEFLKIKASEVELNLGSELVYNNDNGKLTLATEFGTKELTLNTLFEYNKNLSSDENSGSNAEIQFSSHNKLTPNNSVIDINLYVNDNISMVNFPTKLTFNFLEIDKNLEDGSSVLFRVFLDDKLLSIENLLFSIYTSYNTNIIDKVVLITPNDERESEKVIIKGDYGCVLFTRKKNKLYAKVSNGFIPE